MVNSKTLFFAALIVLSSCNPKKTEFNSPNLLAKYDSLQNKYKLLAHKNDSLISALNSIKKENGPDKQDLDESDNVLLKYKLSLTRVKTGYIASDYENLFLPSITLEFKNLSQNDLKDDITIDVYFMNNKTGEQISTDYDFFTDKYTILMGGLTKQVTLKSKVGWSAIQNQDITVRLYINNHFFRLYKIENTDNFGRL